MRKLKDLFLISVVLLLVSCSMSAKSDKNETGGVAAQGEVVVLNKADFLTKVYNYEKNQSEWVYEGTKPCIVDFYADWCGPCKKVSPILKELAGEYKNDIIIYKINVDNEKELAAAFGIQSIPTLLFIPAKGKPQIAQGALSKEQFVEQINGFLLGKK
ncbi:MULTISPECIES: thioredoxin [Parabacteroides]|jgi:thioredoxin|uniref:Thioredoxin n=1 Tax=Parabacteroides faecis TaxID=1217282 RepID=A0ABR6KQP4_9BACT|nr:MULTISPECIES: thioredoxin [Parabacteroides]MBB4623835.1 thioredoxin [Parabacteroides faecis]MBC8617406.1 thioredoxin [Parabacteroides faecis]MCS2893959.1 thioredoxin [Parabacteroides faecis]RHR39529.1 thioredoxin [Parabacteroides sp. AF18-52]RHR96566.1 thioredoxin [Parabacteroides sp. AF14-59]